MRLSKYQDFYYGSVANPIPGVDYIVAESNGIVTRDGDWLVHTLPVGIGEFNVISNNGGHTLRRLVGAGAGAGGSSSIGSGAAGGGGGGEVVETSWVPSVRSFASLVGAGGLKQNGSYGFDGENTTCEDEIGTTTCIAGGGGGGSDLGTSGDGRPGASGGGNGWQRTVVTGFGIPGKGNNGGRPTNAGFDSVGGGGGFTSVGGNATSDAKGGDGGTGFLSDITGTNKYYGCGGGGGGGQLATSGSVGGNNTGGNGGWSFPYVLATNPISQSCSGGGGGGSDTNGTTGADGVVIYRYYSPEATTFFLYTPILTNNP